MCALAARDLAMCLRQKGCVLSKGVVTVADWPVRIFVSASLTCHPALQTTKGSSLSEYVQAKTGEHAAQLHWGCDSAGSVDMAAEGDAGAYCSCDSSRPEHAKTQELTQPGSDDNIVPGQWWEMVTYGHRARQREEGQGRMQGAKWRRGVRTSRWSRTMSNPGMQAAQTWGRRDGWWGQWRA